jgi:hypothetical protein
MLLIGIKRFFFSKIEPGGNHLFTVSKAHLNLSTVEEYS